ncbi:hypothetical protein BCR43DRAFT_495533 [Syncephalastrum racemosum]|uniref:MARVEL domain-containing protein n=1 Tax=Syncephalastrum racemosum TaxID=13706 RepID=A0A1X2H605_SYNRA|nr:hypothetical protein BCR43DRAFT_495533 [Syncephalastrum racemosum]
MPSPSDYRSTPTNWNESTKIEQPAPSASPKYNFDNSATPVGASENAYQFSGTRLGNQDFGSGDAYSKVQVENGTPSPSPAPAPTPAGGKPRPNEVEGALPPVWDDKRLNPSKLRLLLRFLQFIAAIGHLGFAAGASPFSGEDVPFDSKACFYFLYAVAILTIIWAFFHIIFYLYRRVSHGNKLNRVLMTGTDLLLCILWGIGIIVEIAMYRCSPGGHSHWCDL